MAKKSARKEITKINLKQAALEGLSYERACETAKRAGKPSYRFTVGDKVQVGHLLNCVVDEALEGGYMYLMRFLKRMPGLTLIFQKLIPNTASSLRAAAARPEPQQTA